RIPRRICASAGVAVSATIGMAYAANASAAVQMDRIAGCSCETGTSRLAADAAVDPERKSLPNRLVAARSESGELWPRRGLTSSLHFVAGTAVLARARSDGPRPTSPWGRVPSADRGM